MSKVIFLDIDGVLNDEETNATTPSGHVGIRDKKVKLLKKIVEATDAKVVISSDWRLCDHAIDKDYKYLRNKLKYVGNIEIYGTTPNINWQHRGAEIRRWLQDNPTVKDYVILDDIEFNDFYPKDFYKHVVITDFYYGLTEEDVDEAIHILNGEFFNDRSELCQGVT